jgi:hypothetical protein
MAKKKKGFFKTLGGKLAQGSKKVESISTSSKKREISKKSLPTASVDKERAFQVQLKPDKVLTAEGWKRRLNVNLQRVQVFE